MIKSMAFGKQTGRSISPDAFPPYPGRFLNHPGKAAFLPNLQFLAQAAPPLRTPKQPDGTILSGFLLDTRYLFIYAFPVPVVHSFELPNAGSLPAIRYSSFMVLEVSNEIRGCHCSSRPLPNISYPDGWKKPNQMETGVTI